MCCGGLYVLQVSTLLSVTFRLTVKSTEIVRVSLKGLLPSTLSALVDVLGLKHWQPFHDICPGLFAVY